MIHIIGYLLTLVIGVLAGIAMCHPERLPPGLTGKEPPDFY